MIPKVSVIVPCYNKGNLIEETVQGFTECSYKNIELILINDKSTDPITINSLEKLKTSQAIIISNKNNLGVAKSLNLGIKRATGKYILFSGNDDQIGKDYIKRGVDFLEENASYAFVYPDMGI